MRDFLKEKPVTLSRSNRDGRVASSSDEGIIIQHLKSKGFDILEPPSRAWYDLLVTSEGVKYPINIKTSKLNSNDNVQCKLGIYYAVTGIWPTFQNEISWGNFFEKIGKDLNKNIHGDYYFLVVGKDDTRDVIATSLKQIGTLVPNGNNLPFQCRWGTNRELVERSQNESTKFILGVLGESCKLRANIKSEFEQYIERHL
jgi:hypothetical protein